MATFAKKPIEANIRRRHSEMSTTSSLPEYELGDYPHIQDLAASSSQSEASSLPDYDDISRSAAGPSSSASPVAAFSHTDAFQIETAGHPTFHLPLPPKPVPIPVFRVDADGTIGDMTYESLRAKRSSGSCSLVRAGAGDLSEAPVCSTTYRFGPGKNPQMQLHGRLDPHEQFEVVGRGFTTRAQRIRTHLGTFEWRYAPRADRKAVGANSLLLLERVTTVAVAGGKQEEHRAVVGMLVRNAELRTMGSSGCTAGNGGRLLLNLTEWAEEKIEREQMEIFAISSCIVMLKKEVDRRRAQQFMIMAGAAGGGP